MQDFLPLSCKNQLSSSINRRLKITNIFIYCYLQANGINICDLARNFDGNPKGRKADIFQLNFQKDLRPILYMMDITDFKGKSIRKAAMEIRSYIIEHCYCLIWRNSRDGYFCLHFIISLLILNICNVNLIYALW